jgi:hypothetical protein
MITPIRTSLAIATAVVLASVAIPVAAATTGARNSTRLSQPSTVERIVAQEQGRRGDPRIFGSSGPAPVQIVQVPGGFDWGDAGIGGAATLALVLLLAGGAALGRESRRQEAHG